MSDNLFSPISGPAPGFQSSQQRIDQAQQKSVENSTARGDPSSSVQMASQMQSSGHSMATPQSVHLQFKIDPDTNDITVIVMDRESEQVIRTIPPEELSDLVEGDLLEILT